MTIIYEVVSFLNHLIWGKLLIYLLLAAGLYFTLATRFLQIRHFTHIFTVMRHSRRGDKSGISSFQALCTSLASRVGTGNLAGVAIAMYLGGPGAIFWMWVTAGIGMATAFIESTLAQVYKVKDDSGHYRGGPAYYMTMGLRARWLGTLFSLCLILAYGFAFNGVQANSISESLALTFSLPHWITGIIVTLLSGLIIFGGLRGISRFAEWAVPIMAGIYLLVALGIIALNINQLPHILSTIVHSAFGLAQAGGGAAGYLLTLAMTNGIKRGLFSNEAGMGSAPNIAASASTYPPHPATQGYVQMLGPFLDTIVICTCTAAIIMLSGQLSPGSGITGVALTQRALVHEVGHWANLFLSVAIFLFAFTTIVGNYAYAENNLFFLRCEPWKGRMARWRVVRGSRRFSAERSECKKIFMPA